VLRLPQVKGNHALAGLSSMHPDACSSGTQARTENGWPADAPCGSPLLDCRRSAGTGRGAGATACSRGSVGGGWAVGRPSRSGARGYTSSSPRAGFGLERFAHAAHGIDPASSTETVIRNCRPHGQRAMMPILVLLRRRPAAAGGRRDRGFACLPAAAHWFGLEWLHRRSGVRSKAAPPSGLQGASVAAGARHVLRLAPVDAGVLVPCGPGGGVASLQGDRLAVEPRPTSPLLTRAHPAGPDWPPPPE